VHRQISAQPRIARCSDQSGVHAGKRETDAGEQQGIGVEPDLHLVVSAPVAKRIAAARAVTRASAFPARSARASAMTESKASSA